MHTPTPKGKKGCRDYIIEEAIKRGMRLDDNGKLILPSGREWKSMSQAHHGYRRVTLWHDGKKVSITHGRIMCWLINGPPPHPSWMCDHINGNRMDDRPCNLRWVNASTNSSNVTHDRRVQMSMKMQRRHDQTRRMKASYEAMRAALERVVAYHAECIQDRLNPCLLSGVFGKHWGLGDACAACTARQALDLAEGKE